LGREIGATIGGFYYFKVLKFYRFIYPELSAFIKIETNGITLIYFSLVRFLCWRTFYTW